MCGESFQSGCPCSALRAAAACGGTCMSSDVVAGGLKARTQARGRQGLLARQAAEASRCRGASRPSLLQHSGTNSDSLGKHSSWTAPARLNGNDSSILQQLSQNLSAPAPESRAGVCRTVTVCTCLMCSLVCASALVVLGPASVWLRERQPTRRCWRGAGCWKLAPERSYKLSIAWNHKAATA